MPLASDYRPYQFKDVVGQDVAVDALKAIAKAEGIKARSIFLKGSFGAGKCIVGDQRISTSKGYIKIKDIATDSLQYDEEGFSPLDVQVEQFDTSFEHTSHVFRQSNQEVAYIKTLTNRYFTGTPEHKILVLRHGEYIPTLTKVEDIRKGDYVIQRRINPRLYSFEGLESYFLYGFLSGAFNSVFQPSPSFKDGCYIVKSMIDLTSIIQSFKFKWVSHELVGRLHQYTIDKSILPSTKFGSIPQSVFSSRSHSFFFLYGYRLACNNSINTPNLGYSYALRDICSYLSIIEKTKLYKKDRHSTRNYNKKPINYYSLSFTDSGSNTFNGYLYTLTAKTYEPKLDTNSPNYNSSSIEELCKLLDSLREYYDDKSKYDLFQIAKKVLRKDHQLPYHILKQIHDYFINSAIVNNEAYNFYCIITPFKQLVEFYYDEVQSISFKEETVYDVTVPTTHVFMSQNTLNHNTTTARLFGKAINCETFKETGEVCEKGHECKGCIEANRQNSQVYYEFDSTRVGNVEAIRGMENLFASSVPFGMRRTIVLDEVHAVSRAAMNSLLKVIEEGVRDTFLVFCSTEAILPTIESRSIILEIGTVPVHLIEKRVKEVAEAENINISDEEIKVLALKSMGHVRNSLSLLEKYQLVGKEALKTPLRSLKKLVYQTIRRDDISETLTSIMSYPLVDIQASISLMVKDFFVPEEKFDQAVHSKGLHHKIFNYFYQPVVREALKDEYGTEIALRDFYEVGLK